MAVRTETLLRFRSFFEVTLELTKQTWWKFLRFLQSKSFFKVE